MSMRLGVTGDRDGTWRCSDEFHPALGQVPCAALITSGCIGHVHADGAAATSFIPHCGQVPCSALITSGCIGHVQADGAAATSFIPHCGQVPCSALITRDASDMSRCLRLRSGRRRGAASMIRRPRSCPGSIAVCVDPHPFSRQVGTGAELFELGEEGFVDRLVGHGDGAEDVALCWCVVGDGEFAGVSKSTSMMRFRWRQQYVVDEGVSLVAAAVAADQLHPAPGW